MIHLRTKGIAHNITTELVAEIVYANDEFQRICQSNEPIDEVILSGVNHEKFNSEELKYKKTISGISSLADLVVGDVVLINPDGRVNTIFRKNSPNNSLFITDRCNSNCLMCSQPPKNKDDLDYFFSINSRLIKLIPKSTKELGITGGEPTLLGRRLVILLEMITEQLPETEIHILSNGRAFAWQTISEALSKVDSKRIVFGIPLYSDFYQHHDYIVQAKQAFNQTVLGLHNMARYNFRLELRVVLHELTYQRLPDLAKFIFKNFPFLEHIAFMGLEYTGYTPYNSKLLWIEPSKYIHQLEEATYYLESMGMNVSIYNLPLCLLPNSLWRFARNSISDWKKEFLEECKKCSQIENCGGLFATSKKHSNEIRAIV